MPCLLSRSFDREGGEPHGGSRRYATIAATRLAGKDLGHDTDPRPSTARRLCRHPCGSRSTPPDPGASRPSARAATVLLAQADPGWSYRARDRRQLELPVVLPHENRLPGCLSQNVTALILILAPSLPANKARSAA